MTTYKIFGAGAGGLYTAWRLITGGTLQRGDSVELIEWGNYAFDGAVNPTRPPAGRICTHHYKGDPTQSYVELGGMRYVEWDPVKAQGHQLVTKTIEKLGLNDLVVDFETTGNPLFYLRDRRFYQGDLGPNKAKAPYNTGANDKPSDNLATHISKLMTGTRDLGTRAAQCEFYSTGTLPDNFAGKSFVYRPADPVGNIGYWNFFYDQAGNEGYDYYGDAGGYTSNVIAWNAADAAIYNGEFAPGGAFKTLSRGYSALFARLYSVASAAAQGTGFTFTLTQNTRLHSIWLQNGPIFYRTAPAATPFSPPSAPLTADYAFLCMPPRSIEFVANATRYLDMTGKVDFLNNARVQNFLESVILQPSYKVAMFFDHPWWNDSNLPFGPKLGANVFGPTVTDIALRQVYYFGNNGTASPPVYGLLASYDDMEFTTFWQQMQLSGKERRKVPLSQDYQPLLGPAKAPDVMERMLRLELAKVHFTDWPPRGDRVPQPKETSFLNWGLNPFGAGYHGWSSHYDIGTVMQWIRVPTVMAANTANVFIVGEAFSNDQGWVEGAFCTAESVLVDFLGLKSIADTSKYPLICKPSTATPVGP
jgi:hypothetical protein